MKLAPGLDGGTRLHRPRAARREGHHHPRAGGGPVRGCRVRGALHIRAGGSVARSGRAARRPADSKGHACGGRRWGAHPRGRDDPAGRVPRRRRSDGGDDPRGLAASRRKGRHPDADRPWCLNPDGGLGGARTPGVQVRPHDDRAVAGVRVRADEPPRGDPGEPTRGPPHARPARRPRGRDVPPAARRDRVPPADGRGPSHGCVRTEDHRLRPRSGRLARRRRLRRPARIAALAGPGTGAALPRDSRSVTLPREGSTRRLRGDSGGLTALRRGEFREAGDVPGGDLVRRGPREFFRAPPLPQRAHGVAVHLLRDFPLGRVVPSLDLRDGAVRREDLRERSDRHHEVGLEELGELAFVEPRRLPVKPALLDEGVVLPVQVGTVGAADDAEVRLCRDARDLAEGIPPVGDEMEDVIRRRDVERPRGEGKPDRVREDDVPQAFREAQLDHRVGDVDADDVDAALLERHRKPAGPHADLQDALATELIDEDAEDPRQDPRRQAPRLIVDRGDAVEREAVRHPVGGWRCGAKMCSHRLEVRPQALCGIPRIGSRSGGTLLRRAFIGLVIAIAVVSSAIVPVLAAIGTSSSDVSFILTGSAPHKPSPPVILSLQRSPNGTVYAGDYVYFSANASDPDGGTIVSYEWSFGDGFVDTTSYASDYHVYSSAGNYTMTLTVTDSDQGLTASKSILVTVVERPDVPPVASFYWYPFQPTVGTYTSFVGYYSYDPDGYITDYAWDFGDGSSTNSSDCCPSHVYNATGNYLVTLTVTDNAGLTGTASANITVVSDLPPVASFTWYPQVPSVNQTVFFNAGFYSYDPDGYIVSWNWSFGDGTGGGGGGNRSGNSSGPGPYPTHVYSTFGFFVVTLNVTDNAGLSTSVSKTIYVNALPVAAFTTSTEIGKIGTPVLFDASASTDPDGDPLNYSWSFGDGSYAAGKIVSHVFATQGQYLIVLDVSDPYGDGLTSRYLAVVPPKSPTAIIAWTPPRPIAGQTNVEFNGSNSFDPDGVISRYIWEFGDGVVGSGLTATHIYADAGTYTVELIVVDEDGVANRDTQTITVLARSKATVAAADLQTPIAGAQVSLSQGGSVVLDILTASDGGFSLGDLAPGTYAIAISKAGFETYSGTLAWDGLNGDLGTFVLAPLSTPGGPVGVLPSAGLAAISLGAGAGIGVALYLFRKRRPRAPRNRAD